MRPCLVCQGGQRYWLKSTSASAVFSVLALYFQGTVQHLKINLDVGCLAVVTPILSLVFLVTLYLRETNWLPAETREF